MMHPTAAFAPLAGVMRTVMAVTIAAGLLAGCATPQPADEPIRVVFLCDRGQNITVTFQGDGARLESGEGLAQLRAQRVASGIHYAGEGHDLRGKGPDAVWTDPSGVARNCQDQAWAMQQPQIQEPLAHLEGTSWRLVRFESSDDAIGAVTPPRVERYTLSFDADGAVAMQLDCNRGAARWAASPTSARGGSLSMTPGAMTRAFCGEDSMDARIAQDMSRVRTFTLANGQLNLALEADAGIYVWEPAPGG